MGISEALYRAQSSQATPDSHPATEMELRILWFSQIMSRHEAGCFRPRMGRARLLVIASCSGVYEVLCLFGAEDDLGKVRYHMGSTLVEMLVTPHSEREWQNSCGLPFSERSELNRGG